MKDLKNPRVSESPRPSSRQGDPDLRALVRLQAAELLSQKLPGYVIIAGIDVRGKA